MAQSSPWAILLTKWKDNDAEPRPRSFFESLFTSAGAGTFNMTDFFGTMSHGKLDLSGSAVHGWFTLDQPQTDYVGNATPQPGQLGRNELRDAAIAKAVANGVNLSKYAGVVVVMNTNTDLCGWTGGMAALCDPGSFEPAVLGQEMGHGYGLDHSKVDGSEDHYQDPWDTMSTWDGCYMASDPAYTLIGPGLNAPNMRYMGWLDETRVWKASTHSFDQQIVLRPLHSRDLPGHLAAEVPGVNGGFLVEFRVNEDWDSGFPRSAVFVHRFANGHSYRMLGTGGNSDLVVGDRFTWGNSSAIFAPYTEVIVDEINTKRHFARVTLRYRAAVRIPAPWVGAGQLIGGIEVDGGGFIIVNGVPHPVGPWDPLLPVLTEIISHSRSSLQSTVALQIDAKRTALKRIVHIASQALNEMDDLHSPAPRMREKYPERRVRQLAIGADVKGEEEGSGMCALD